MQYVLLVMRIAVEVTSLITGLVRSITQGVFFGVVVLAAATRTQGTTWRSPLSEIRLLHHGEK